MPRYLPLLLAVLALDAHAETPRRPLLTTSRVVGSPEPPYPYRTRRAFPKLSFSSPLYIVNEPGSDRLLVVERFGKILGFPNDQTVEKTHVFCDVKNHETYGMSFHPRYGDNRFVYIFANGSHSDTKKKNRIYRYVVEKTGIKACDPKSQTLIIEWESNGHNGGDMAWGKDGYLYITAGDGTSDSDGDVTGQDLRDLCSGVLRIDVDHPDAGKCYSVPKDNPFLHLKDARPELFAFGFRNPWRIAHDPRTDDFWIGDIGQDLWEMIHLLKRGGNYGWSVYEGSHPFRLQRKLGPAPVIKPVIEHAHAESRSITGGIVYMGDKLKDLHGAYLYGDYSTGKIWGMRYENGKVTWHRELDDTPYQILGFGQGPKGEVYVVDFGGQLGEVEVAPPEPSPPPFPKKLSETGLFVKVEGHVLQPGLIPYTVNAALWSDGAFKERFIGLPGAELIDFGYDHGWRCPEKTVAVKTFSLEMEAGNSASRRRIETRLLTVQRGEWVGYSYLWNDAQTDADLVPVLGQDREYVIKDRSAAAGVRKQIWHYPSRAECMVCHSRAANFALGLSTLQMNKHLPNGVEQLEQLEQLGVFRVNVVEHWAAWKGRWNQAVTRLSPFPLLTWLPHGNRVESMVTRVTELGLLQPVTSWVSSLIDRSPWGKWSEVLVQVRNDLDRKPRYTAYLPKRPLEMHRLADPYDAKLGVDRRARSYLHANCAMCHVDAGGGNSAINLSFHTGRAQMLLFDVKPAHDSFGIKEARLVAPGDPSRSLLLHRVSQRGEGKMPPLSSSLVDEPAVRLLRAWIEQEKLEK
jgi:glucose/arabinose dehydrogenase